MSYESKLEFPDCLLVRVVEGDTSVGIANVAVMIRLYATRKNDYGFLPPLSDLSGIVRISRAWVATSVEETRNFFPMDYSSTISQCLPYVDLRVMTVDQLEAAIAARDLYREAPKMGVEPTASDMANAANKGYEPKTVRVPLHVPGISVKEVVIELRRTRAN